MSEHTTITPRLLADVAEYLDGRAQELVRNFSAPPDGKISEPSIRDEVKRVRAWASKLRRAALQELSP